MAGLQGALHAHREAVDGFLAAARDVPAARWSQPRAPGKWSPGQVVEHLALGYEVNRGVLRGESPGAAPPRFLRPLIRRFLLGPVLRRGRFIPGSRTSAALRPGASPAAPTELLGRLRAAAEAFEADVGSLGVATIDHPFFGRLPLADLVRLQEIHARHHRGQLAPVSA